MPSTGATTAERTVTVLLVDDQGPVRAAMREVIEATDGFTLVGEAASGVAALQAAEQLLPAMVIIDKRMPGMEGPEATRLLTARHPQVVVLLVSADEPDAEVIRLSGAAAYARKQEFSRRLLRDVWEDATAQPRVAA
jgi:DNA-binding NarL/FixJ family response regulator